MTKKLTVDELSQRAGIQKERIIDLELGTLSLSEATAVAEALKPILKIDEKTYRLILLSSAQKQ